MTAQPTQVTYPGKAMARTAIQIIIGMAAAMPVLVAELGVDRTGGIVAGVLAISAVVTRIMAIPAVNTMLARYFRLGAAPLGSDRTPSR